MMNNNTRKQISLYIFGARELPEYAPAHIKNAAVASRQLFECLNDENSAYDQIVEALKVKKVAAREFMLVEETPWLW